MTPDWSAKPVTVPYAKFGDPQSLNLYSYVENGPINRVDADGHGYARFDTPNGTSGEVDSFDFDVSFFGSGFDPGAQGRPGKPAADQQQNQPQPQLTYEKLARNCPGHDKYPTDPALPGSIWALIGGYVEKNERDSNGNPSNSCAVRMSYALNKSGVKIPRKKNETISGANGEQYFLRVRDLQKFLVNALGAPEHLAGGNFHGPSGRSGIVSFNIPFNDATGHFTLWNGQTVIDRVGEGYDQWPLPTSALFWSIK